MEDKTYVPAILKQKDNTIRRAAALIVKLGDELKAQEKKTIQSRHELDLLENGFSYGGKK